MSEDTTNQIEHLRAIDPTVTLPTEPRVLATCTGERISPTEVGKWLTAKDRTERFKLRFKTTRHSPGVKVFQDISDTPKYEIELTWGTIVGLQQNNQGKWEAVFPASAIRGVTPAVGVA